MEGLERLRKVDTIIQVAMIFEISRICVSESCCFIVYLNTQKNIGEGAFFLLPMFLDATISSIRQSALFHWQTFRLFLFPSTLLEYGLFLHYLREIRPS